MRSWSDSDHTAPLSPIPFSDDPEDDPADPSDELPVSPSPSLPALDDDDLLLTPDDIDILDLPTSPSPDPISINILNATAPSFSPTPASPGPPLSFRSRYTTSMHRFKVHRAPKKIPRKVVISVLRGKVKQAYFKFGLKIPGTYKEAISPSNPDAPAWQLGMSSEVDDLSSLGAFQKGFFADSIDIPFSQVIRSMWVYDVKADGRKRPRLVARDDMMSDTDVYGDTYSPVVQL